QTLAEAEEHVLGALRLQFGAKSAGFGGSATLAASNLTARLKALPDFEVIDRNDPALSPPERQELSRRTLLTDLFVCSVNALTVDGELVNIDKFGNRVAALSFGPKNVAVLVGRNKIVDNLPAALARAKNQAAALNALRLGMNTPCAKTFACHDCRGAERLCGVTVVTHRSCPDGRIHVLLINQDLGF
ncbi:MAG: lactate utilization protein, partial [Deltaproteobacteria bacterium]|nr:lactate utilization protein [Deltaproteobacteria bacterium]